LEPSQNKPSQLVVQELNHSVINFQRVNRNTITQNHNGIGGGVLLDRSVTHVLTFIMVDDDDDNDNMILK
jgi:hypothetical protein